jgi:hypothetical protein
MSSEDCMFVSVQLKQRKPHPCAQIISEFNTHFKYKNPYLTRDMKFFYSKHGVEYPCFEFVSFFNRLVRCSCSNLVCSPSLECKSCGIKCCADCYRYNFNAHKSYCDECISQCCICNNYSAHNYKCENCFCSVCDNCSYKVKLSAERRIFLCDVSCMTVKQHEESDIYMDECFLRKINLVKALNEYNVPLRADDLSCEKYVDGCFTQKDGWELERVVLETATNCFLEKYTHFKENRKFMSRKMAVRYSLEEIGLFEMPVSWPWTHKIRTDHYASLCRVHDEMALIPSWHSCKNGSVFEELCLKYKDHGLFKKDEKKKNPDMA